MSDRAELERIEALLGSLVRFYTIWWEWGLPFLVLTALLIPFALAKGEFLIAGLAILGPIASYFLARLEAAVRELQDLSAALWLSILSSLPLAEAPFLPERPHTLGTLFGILGFVVLPAMVEWTGLVLILRHRMLARR
ncbi:MAG: hypothetical protein U0X73_01375 [Thermoanaerobaculia bacterium]